MFRSARACCNTTADTSPNHARSGVFFASVMTRLDRSPSETYCNRLLAGLLPGAQPIVEHHPGTPERPRQRLLLTGVG